MTALEVTPTPDSGKVRVMTISQAVSRYTGELTRAGRAESTLHRYEVYLNQLADMYPWVDIEDVTREMWLKWLDHICAGKGGKHLDQDTVSQRVTIAKRFSSWLRQEDIITKDPLERVTPPKRKNPIENDRVVWLTDQETMRMLAVAKRDIELGETPQDQYRKLLCLAVLAYTGSRRGAVSDLRISDYDGAADPPTLTFRVEKGGKFIKKPLAKPLAYVIREADMAGVWNEPNDYLIPSLGTVRGSKRDSRIIYRLVKEVAADAKVEAHVHALRAAFACFFLENNPDQLTALKDLLGHSNVTTTEIYLRRMNRQRGMEVVVDLDWGTDRVGFEPTERLSDARRLSKPLPSASRAPIQDADVTGDTFRASAQPEPIGAEPSIHVLPATEPNDCLGKPK